MPLKQPVRPGLSAPAIGAIPTQWSAAWFRGFITNYLGAADARNATQGGGVSVTPSPAGPSVPPTISLEQIAANTVLANLGAQTAAPTGVALTSLSANPTAQVGLAAVDGTSAKFMRADGAPALSQDIAPTWTENHTFAPASGNTDFTHGNVAITYSFGLNGATPPTQVVGFGTPTGASVVANFSGTAATTAQIQATIAEILTIMKAYGLIGA
jgi:hypothetical protein